MYYVCFFRNICLKSTLSRSVVSDFRIDGSNKQSVGIETKQRKTLNINSVWIDRASINTLHVGNMSRELQSDISFGYVVVVGYKHIIDTR